MKFKLLSLFSCFYKGRCYIPSSYFTGDELKYLTHDRKPDKIPNAQLKTYAEKILDIADRLSGEAPDLYLYLIPDECSRAALAKMEINKAIGNLIRSNRFYVGRQASLTKFETIYIALKCVYFKSLVLRNRRNK